MAVLTGFEPAIFCVTGRRDKPLHYRTKWLRRKDSNLRPLGYEPNELPAAPLRDIMAEEAGFEPARAFTPVGFQDRSLQPDLGIPPFISDNIQLNWWIQQDSNLRPPGYEPDALTN